MTGPLALVGGEEFSAGCLLDDDLIASVGAEEVAVLATGSAYENPGRVIAAAREWFGARKVAVREVPVYVRTDALSAENIDAVRWARMVYVVGASPMHIRSVFKDTPLFEALVDAWNRGAALVGSGAGADVICDPMVDTRGGAFTVGLGLLPGVSVITHSDQWSPDKIHRTVDLAPPDVAVVSLPRRTAIVLDDPGSGVWRAVGPGTVTVHRAGLTLPLSELPRPPRT